MSIYAENCCSESSTHPMKIIPVRGGWRIGELPVLIHEVKLISRQKRGQNQLQLQLRHLHPRTGVPTGSPAEERIGDVRNRVRSQPPTGIVLVRFRVVFGVQVDFAQGISDEITPFDHSLADLESLMKVPSDGDTGNDYSV